jgi:hypothetical protein
VGGLRLNGRAGAMAHGTNDGCTPQVRPTSVAKVVKIRLVGREWQIYTY